MPVKVFEATLAEDFAYWLDGKRFYVTMIHPQILRDLVAANLNGPCYDGYVGEILIIT